MPQGLLGLRATVRGPAVVALMVAALVAGSSVPSASAATGQPAEGAAAEDLLRITSVSPWVQPEGVFQVRFVPTAEVPAGSLLTWTVHQRLVGRSGSTLREQVARALEEGPDGGVLRAPVTRPIAELGDPAAGLSLDVPLRTGRDGSDRLLLTRAGPYPVELVLLSPDGPELWRRTVLLNRLPDEPVTDEDGAPTVVRTALLLAVDSPPALRTTGSPRFDAATRNRLTGATRLLTHPSDPPFTVLARGNTLDGLDASAEPWALRLLDALSAEGRAARAVALPYVGVTSGGLVEEEAAAQLAEQVAVGRQTVERLTGRAPRGDTWVLDSTLSVGALDVLGPLGVDAVVVDPARARTTGTERATARTAPLPVTGRASARALAVDPELGAVLVGEEGTPAVRSHRLVSELMAAWFTATDEPRSRRSDPAVVVAVDPSVDPEVLTTLVPALTGGGPLVADPEGPVVPEVDEDRRGSLTLQPAGSPDQGAPVLGSIGTAQLLASYRTMVGDADPLLGQWTRLNQQTLSLDLTPGGRTATHRAVARQVGAQTQQVQTPPDRGVVLTSRTATVPLRFRNRLDFPVKVLLRVRSPRLSVEGGRSRVVELAPGTNRVDLEVTSRAPGQSLLRVETRSPDGRIVLATTSVPVRSQTISGVGAAISVVSLVFLLLWWVNSSRRRRRRTARTAGHHPTAADRAGPDPAGTGTAGTVGGSD